MNTHVEMVESLGRMSLAVVLGSAIGFERQWHQKMAGLRTNALVALGSCGFVVFSAMVAEGDPTRVAAQVVTGIGFLGAGVILREGVNVHGLNTAATLWCSAMVGTFAGGGFWVPSIVAAGFIVATNLLLRPLVRLINSRAAQNRDAETSYLVSITCNDADEKQLRTTLVQVLTQGGLALRRVDSADIPATTRVRISAHVVSATRNDAALEQIAGVLSLEPRISAVRWEIDGTASES
jgi:putative Mg2+ transporter-C (MgtC) family protein